MKTSTSPLMKTEDAAALLPMLRWVPVTLLSPVTLA